MILVAGFEGQTLEEIRATLVQNWPIKVVGFHTLLGALNDPSIEVLVLDGALLNQDSRLIWQVRFECPSLRIVLVASSDSFESQVNSLRYGILDVVKRHTFAADLLFAVEQATQTPAPKLPQGLSLQSLDWIHHVVDGLSTNGYCTDWSSIGRYLTSFSRSRFFKQVWSSYKTYDQDSSFRVCIVEDEYDLAMVMKRVFERSGCIVDVCGTLTDARLYFKSQPKVDCLILDLSLPDGTGEALIEVSDTCVLVLTAYEDLDMAIRSIQLGAMDYMTKPFENQVLVNTVRRLILEGFLLKAFRESSDTI